MSWNEYSNYRKRIWDIEYDGSKVHLIFIEINTKYKSPYLEIRWRSSKFRGVGFNFFATHTRKDGPDWKQIFARLRISLAYGMNPATRVVTDKLMQVDISKPHPIHRSVRTSSAL